MSSFLQDLGRRIRRERIEHRKTQCQLAVDLNLSEYTVKNWEAGIRPMNVFDLVALAALFHVSAGYLVGEGPEKPPITDPRFWKRRVMPPPGPALTPEQRRERRNQRRRELYSARIPR